MRTDHGGVTVNSLFAALTQYPWIVIVIRDSQP